MSLHRLFFSALVCAFVFWLVVALRASGAPAPGPAPDDGGAAPSAPPPTSTSATAVPPPVLSPVHDLEVAALRARLKREHTRLVAARHRVRSLTRTLAHRSSTREAIELACSVYGNCSLLWRRADCESHVYALAKNPSGASGLFQFLPSTWSTTPFASLSIWSPYANALAAGWMQTHGRGGEWSCR